MDRGIKNIVVGSNKQFFKSLHLKEIKGKYQYKKKVLQSKGTKSALRKLKRIAGKERRFVYRSIIRMNCYASLRLCV